MLPDAAVAYDAGQRRLTAATLALIRSAWALMTADFDRSWSTQGPRVALAAQAAQLGAARAAMAYLAEVLPQVGIADDPVADVDPRGFVGFAGDGRPVDSLLFGAVTEAKRASSTGAGPQLALAQGGRWLDMVAHTLVADTGRAAVSVGMTVRPAVTGYVRMLQLPSCGRCVILAGRWYRVSAGFQRHPRCLPAGVVVSGPSVDAATRRWYQGELVVIKTAGGEQLPVTGNHPVLTDRGWLPSHLVEEGSYVVRSTRSQGAGALVVPDEDQVPARIEDLWRPDGVVPLRQVPTSTEDFHGDGGHGKVDVVLADRLLWDDIQSSGTEHLEKGEFTGRVDTGIALPESRTGLKQFQRVPPPTGLVHVRGCGHQAGATRRLLRRSAAPGGVRPSELRQRLFDGHMTGPDLARLGPVANLSALLDQAPADCLARHAVATAEAVLALTGGVGSREVVDGQHPHSPRWDPPAGPLTMQSRAAYADFGEDLRLRLTGQVALDRVVEVSRVEWSGHVYNLTSTEGWYSANGLIVSNCDCRHIPATENIAGDLTTDPRAAYEAGQVRGLTETQDKALQQGADLAQVVNSRRGMDSADARTTREAAGRGGRLSPEGVYAKAGDDRAAAVELLRRNGYLT